MKAGRKRLDEEWKMIRRGWYLGGDGFRGRLVKLIKQTLAVGRKDSYVGLAKQAHGRVEAERLLAEGLAALGVKAKELTELPKGMAEKRVLAWWLRQRTTVGRRWISERLEMGDESRVSRACQLVKAGRDAELERSRKRLVKVGNHEHKIPC